MHECDFVTVVTGVSQESCIREDNNWDFVIVGTLGTRLFGLQHGKGMRVGMSGCCIRNMLTLLVLTRDDLCHDLGKV